MKIFCISDTHGLHGQIKVPLGIDMIIHAGDVGNAREAVRSHNEILDFIAWYQTLNIKYKIFIAGNHDSALELKDYVTIPNDLIYLNHESITIEAINIFGSPYTPTFGNWSFMRSPSKLDAYWQHIPEDTDILVTHGPPKGILDLSHNIKDELEYCGDKSLFNHVVRVNPKYHIFGHIHESKGCLNSGRRFIKDCDTEFINASCVTDGRFDLGLTSNGFTIEI